MDPGLFDKFLKESKKRLNDKKSDSEKVRLFIDWCINNNYEEVILRISSEEKGGWARNYFLDFTTNRVIVTKRAFDKICIFGLCCRLIPLPLSCPPKELKSFNRTFEGNSKP